MSRQYDDNSSLVQESDSYFCPLGAYKTCTAYNTVSPPSMITPSANQMKSFRAANGPNTSISNLTGPVDLLLTDASAGHQSESTPMKSGRFEGAGVHYNGGDYGY